MERKKFHPKWSLSKFEICFSSTTTQLFLQILVGLTIQIQLLFVTPHHTQNQNCPLLILSAMT